MTKKDLRFLKMPTMEMVEKTAAEHPAFKEWLDKDPCNRQLALDFMAQMTEDADARLLEMVKLVNYFQ